MNRSAIFRPDDLHPMYQGDFNCGPSSHPDFIKNYFLLTRMLEFFDRRDKYRKSGLEIQILQILKCIKDQTHAIFFKSMGFKHIKYDIAVYQGWQPFVHLKKSTKSFHGRRIFKFSRLGQLYQHPDGAYCRPMEAIFHIVLCVNRSMKSRHGRIIYHSRSCHLLSLL